MLPGLNEGSRHFHDAFAGAWHNFWHHFTAPTAYLLGSPRALLFLHRAYLFETAGALLLMCTQFMLFLFFTLSFAIPDSPWDPTRVEVILMFIFALFPLIVTMVRLPVLWSLEQRLRALMACFQRGEAGVDRMMLQILQGQLGRDHRVLSGLLVMWYAFSIFWESAAPPCRDLQPLTLGSLPCESLAFASALLLNANMSFFLCSFAALDAVRRYRENFVPPQRRGIPSDLLDRLPSFTYGDPGADDLASECYICLEVFEVGDKIRCLPCSHQFHSACVDEWLIRTPSCPLRCQNNLWAVARDPSAGSRRGEGHSGSRRASADSVPGGPVAAGAEGALQAARQEPGGAGVADHGAVPAAEELAPQEASAQAGAEAHASEAGAEARLVGAGGREEQESAVPSSGHGQQFSNELMRIMTRL